MIITRELVCSVWCVVETGVTLVLFQSGEIPVGTRAVASLPAEVCRYVDDAIRHSIDSTFPNSELDAL